MGIRGNSPADVLCPACARSFLLRCSGNSTTLFDRRIADYDDVTIVVRPTRGQSVVAAMDFGGLGV